MDLGPRKVMGELLVTFTRYIILRLQLRPAAEGTASWLNFLNLLAYRFLIKWFHNKIITSGLNTVDNRIFV